MMKKYKLFSLPDAFLIGFILLACIFLFIMQFSADTAVSAVIKKDGETLREVALERLVSPLEIEIDGEYPLILIIDKTGVCVKNAHCPDKICERTGKITAVSQSIVCLPARVSVELISRDGGGTDAMTG